MNNEIISIIEIVAKEYNLTKDVLVSRQKGDNVVEARNIAIYLCRKKTNCALQELGDFFGNRDHTTIHHVEVSVKQKMESAPEFAEKVKRIDEAVERNATL